MENKWCNQKDRRDKQNNKGLEKRRETHRDWDEGIWCEGDVHKSTSYNYHGINEMDNRDVQKEFWRVCDSDREQNERHKNRENKEPKSIPHRGSGTDSRKRLKECSI